MYNRRQVYCSIMRSHIASAVWGLLAAGTAGSALISPARPVSVFAAVAAAADTNCNQQHLRRHNKLCALRHNNVSPNYHCDCVISGSRTQVALQVGTTSGVLPEPVPDVIVLANTPHLEVHFPVTCALQRYYPQAHPTPS